MKKNNSYLNIIAIFLVFFYSFLSINTYSQTGPGGIGNKDGANGQALNKLWFDASTLGLANGAALSTWTDMSGNDNHATQSITNQRPIYYDANHVDYTFPVIYFDPSGGSDNEDFMPFDGSVIVETDYTVIFVGKRRTSSSKRVVLGGATSNPNQNLHLFWENSTNFKAHHYSNDLSTAMVTSGTSYDGGTDNNTFGIFTTRLGSTEGNPQRKNYQNNHYLGGRDNKAKLTSWNGAAMARYYNGGFKYYDIDLAEVIIYKTALNAAQLEILHNYLSEKYSIEIENDKYTAATGYTYNVAGIGNKSGEKQSRSASAGLYISEDNGSLDDGEYIFIANNNTTNDIASIQTGTNVTNSGAQAAWNRNWYLKKHNVTSTDVKLIFDLPEGISGGQYAKNVTNYVLLHKATSGADYTNIGLTASLADGDQVSFDVANANLNDGYYTLGTLDQTNSPIEGVEAKTWYALISGNWNDWNIWTLDPSGSLPNNPDHKTPSSAGNTPDNVVIHSGKTVTIQSGNNNKNNSSLTVDGRLDLTNTTGHNFTTIKGSGRIFMSADNFPAGDATHFITKGQGEGAVIYYGTGHTLSNARTFYNVEVEFTNDTDILTLMADLTVNGSLTINKGIFQINDNSSTTILNVNVASDVLLESNTKITVGTGNTIGSFFIPGTMPTSGNYHKIFHQLTISGNLTNKGTIRLTNQTDPIYDQFSTTGAASLWFTGTSNSLATLNGTTDLYNLIINKGTDKTYLLTINSNSTNNFKLFGPNNVGRNSSSPFSSENPEIRKALWIYNGTLKLTGSINIPTLSEGTQANDTPAKGNGDYAVGQNGCLWIASSGVTVYSTASKTTQVAAGSETTINTGRSNQAMSVYGKFRISNGFFGTRNSAGFIFWSNADAQVLIEGGEVDVSQIRSGGSGGGVASYTQSGGLLRARGNETEAGDYAGNFPLFGLEGTDAVFHMSGGEILLRDEDGDADPEFSIESSAGNYSVTGGKITIDIKDTRSLQISSTANLWNLDIKNNTGSGNMTVEILSDLKISNDLNIYAYTTLDAKADLTIGGDWTIKDNAIFTANTNTVTFASNDGKSHNLTIENTTTASYLNFYNLRFNHDNADIKTTIVSTGRSATWDNALAEIIIINNDLTTLSPGNFNLGGFHVLLKGNLKLQHSGNVVNGRLKMVGASSQNINTGRGNVSYLIINNSNGVGATGDCRMTGTMELVSGILDIGTYRFWIGNLNQAGVAITKDTDVSHYSSSKMIRTAGNATDGGFALSFSKNEDVTGVDVVFPVGVGTKYTPMQLDGNGVISDSYNNQLTVIPVNSEHPAHKASTKSLNYYWKIKNLGYWGHGFTNSTTDISYKFYYNKIDLPTGYPGNPNDLNYGDAANKFVSMYFDDNNTTWIVEDFTDINGADTLITLNGSGTGLGGVVSGEFTTGEPEAANVVYPIFYSGDHGDWKKKDVWSNDPSGVPLLSNKTPTQYNKVIIKHDIVISNDDQNAYSITLYNSGSLDVGKSTGHSFGIIYPDPDNNRGRFKIASATLPTADFTPFCAKTYATFTYYGGIYTLPNTLEIYPTLIIDSDNSGETKTLPDIDISINGDTKIMDKAVLKLGTATNGNLNAHRVIVQGKILFPNSGNRTVVVNGNLTAKWAGSNRQIDVEDGGDAKHKMYVTKNISLNRGTFDFYGDGGSTIDLYIADTLRVTPNNSVIDNIDYEGGNATHKATIILNRLIIDKGNDQTTTVTCKTDFTLMGATDSDTKALEIKSGTLIMDDHTTADGADTDITLTSGGADFEIPSVACLKVNKGIARVSGSNTGIRLDGKLHVNGGTVNMDDGSNNNYIEYSASGNATLEISDGTLTVGSQIRRATTTEEGILDYIQSGGTVIVGKNTATENTRGVFEILNTGSSFTHSAGSFTIVRQQTNPSIAAFYFDPETATLTAGTNILIGNASTPTNNIIEMYLNKPLKNLTISGNSNLTAKLLTVAAVVEEDLNISSDNTFDANGVQLTIKKDLINNGVFTHGNNLTIFTGSSAQEIKGTASPTFYQLTKQAANTLTLQNDIFVENDLRIEAGTLADNSNNVFLKGNMYNVSTHSHGGTGDGITFNGSKEQYITGSGTYGKITINNANSVIVNVGSDIVINNAIKHERGIFDIGGNLLTLTQNALFIDQNPFSETNMVQTNKSFTDSGIKKHFPSGTGTFLYPIGSGGKYTPIKIIVTQNSSTTAYLIAKAADEVHVTIQEDAETPNIEIDDRDNALKYYWSFKASGFTDGSGNVEFYYNNEDILIENNNGSTYTVADYIPARLLYNNTSWNKFDWADFDETNKKIVFSFSNVNDDGISGDYTAGIQPSDKDRKGAIPDNVTVYESKNNGDWSTASTWNPEIAGGPNGAIVKINAADTVTIDQNYISSFTTEILGTLKQNDKFGNRLGNVKGTGTLYTESGFLPAGYYDDFLSTAGGTLEYSGTTDIDVLNNVSSVNNLKFTGIGERRLPNLNLNVLGTMLIEGTDASLIVRNEYNEKLTIKGDITFNTGAFDAGSGVNAIVEFAGSVAQTISGTNSFIGTNAFNHVQINNSGGLILSKPVEIDNNLVFTTGIVSTSSGKELTLNSINENVITGASSSRYIDGPLVKNISNGGNFEFPLGSASRYGKVNILSVSTGPALWKAEYYNHNPKNDGYDPETINNGTDPDLKVVSDNEYWRIEAPSSATAKVKLRWDANSGLPTDDANRSNLRIAEWLDLSTDAWDDIDDSNIISGTSSSGAITQTNTTSFNKFGTGNFFTLATIYVPISLTWNGSTSIVWNDASNWTGGGVPSAVDDITIPSSGVTNEPTISINAVCGAMRIESSRTLTININSSLTMSGILNMGGNITLKSNASGYASFIDNGIASSTGTATYELYTIKNKFLFISSPVSAAAHTIFSVANPNFYVYDETNADADRIMGWDNPTATAGNMIVGRGYAFYLLDNDNTKVVTGGSFNTGNASIAVTNSNHGVDSDGWNLVGNPYPSALSAETFLTLNASTNGVIDGSIYFWDDDNSKGSNYSSSDYSVWNIAGSVGASGDNGKVPDGKIATGQSFFVHRTSTGSADVQFKNNMRIKGDGQFFKRGIKSEIQKIKLSLSSTNGLYNETVISFKEDANEDHDDMYDAKKIKGNANIALYSKLGNVDYAIQTLPGFYTYKSSKKEILIGYTVGVAGNYSLKKLKFENFDSDVNIYLLDENNNKFVDLRENNQYDFYSETGVFDKRFKIVLRKNQATDIDDKQKSFANIYANNKTLYIKFSSNKLSTGIITVYDLLGTNVYTQNINKTQYVEIPLKLNSGIYIVKIKTNNGIVSKKIFIED